VEYRVIKDIPDGFETGAKEGEILKVNGFEGFYALFLNDKAVCDIDSYYANKHCEPIKVLEGK
jgi:hypothetical protein